MSNQYPVRVLVAKPGLDGHDRGAKIIARALRDAGMEVIYTGIRQTPEMIVEAALQEDVDVIGLSILSGAHLDLFPQIFEGLKINEMEDVAVVAGGIIPESDRTELEAMGVSAVYGPGATTSEIVERVRQLAAERAEQTVGSVMPNPLPEGEGAVRRPLIQPSSLASSPREALSQPESRSRRYESPTPTGRSQ